MLYKCEICYGEKNVENINESHWPYKYSKFTIVWRNHVDLYKDKLFLKMHFKLMLLRFCSQTECCLLVLCTSHFVMVSFNLIPSVSALGNTILLNISSIYIIYRVIIIMVRNHRNYVKHLQRVSSLVDRDKHST